MDDFCPVLAYPEKDFKGKYRCKNANKELYDFMKPMYNEFTSEERLLEMMHGMDTQKNEALNAGIAFKAPKHKNYSTSWSLVTRALTTVSINIVGYVQFYTRLFQILEIDPGSTTINYLKRCEVERQRSYEHKQHTTTKSWRS